MKDTLINVRNELLKFFLQESLISPEKHHNLIEFDCEDKDIKISLIKKELENFEQLQLVKKVQVKETDHWILVKDLKMFEQTVSLSYDIVIGISNVINDYCKSIGNTKEFCDPTQIQERDIRKLVIILDSLVSTVEKN